MPTSFPSAHTHARSTHAGPPGTFTQGTLLRCTTLQGAACSMVLSVRRLMAGRPAPARQLAAGAHAQLQLQVRDSLHVCAPVAAGSAAGHLHVPMEARPETTAPVIQTSVHVKMSCQAPSCKLCTSSPRLQQQPPTWRRVRETSSHAVHLPGGLPSP